MTGIYSVRLRQIYGAAGGTRTPDHLITNQMLYQLSYGGLAFLVPGESRLRKSPSGARPLDGRLPRACFA